MDAGLFGSSENYIEHEVSKLDTLAGIAIKYGVEVSDIKRINGLVIDLQMFAYKTLRIPLPARHTPSAALSFDSENTRSVSSGVQLHHEKVFAYGSGSDDVPGPTNPLKISDSLALSMLRGYYGLSPTTRKCCERMKTGIYKTENDWLSEEEPFTPPGKLEINEAKTFSNEDLLINVEKDVSGMCYLETQNGPFLKEEFVPDANDNECEKSCERSVRRRSKIEGTKPLISSSENGIKQDLSTGKGPLLKPKSSSKISILTDATCSLVHPFVMSEDSVIDGFVETIGMSKGLGCSGTKKDLDDWMLKVKRSSSTSNLQDADTVSPMKLPSRRGAKGDIISHIQSFPTPIFEVINKPISNRQSKAALD